MLEDPYLDTDLEVLGYIMACKKIGPTHDANTMANLNVKTAWQNGWKWNTGGKSWRPTPPGCSNI